MGALPNLTREPRALKGGRSRCEFMEHGHACGFRASWWDGWRFLCAGHRAVEVTP